VESALLTTVIGNNLAGGNAYELHGVNAA
jgi:hypothetical protein